MSPENIPAPAIEGAAEASEDKWMIDGAAERAAEIGAALARRLDAMEWDSVQAASLAEGVAAAIENSVMYGNGGDRSKEIDVEVAMRTGRDDARAVVEVAIAGERSAGKEGGLLASADGADENERTARENERMGELFVHLPADIDVEFFPEENKIVLRQERARS